MEIPAVLAELAERCGVTVSRVVQAMEAISSWSAAAEPVAAIVQVFADLVGQLQQQPVPGGRPRSRPARCGRHPAARSGTPADALDSAHLRLLVAAQEAENLSRSTGRS